MSNRSRGINDYLVRLIAFVLVVVSVVVVGFVFISLTFFWASFSDTTRRGLLESSGDWPEPIQKLAVRIASETEDVPLMQVYLLEGSAGSVLSTVVCRVPYSEEAWEKIQAKLELKPIEPEFLGNLRDQIFSKADRSWWPPKNHAANYFASARLLAGEKDDLYFCSVDPETAMIYIHYRFNF